MSLVLSQGISAISAYAGEAMALLTALIWAFAVILFKRTGETVHPVALNLFKGTFASILIPITMIILGNELFRDVPFWHYLVMLGGGALGLGVADTLFFMSLNRLGASRSAIVDCAYAPSMIIMAVIILGDRLTILQIVGVVLIVAAVLVGNKPERTSGETKKDIALGVIFGVVAMVTMSFSIVSIKPVLDNSPVLWAMELRLLGGNIMLLLMLPFFKKRMMILKSAFHPKGIRYMIPAAFFGTYLALILWLGGMKYASNVSIASSLNQTSNIWIFIFAALMLREKIDRHRAMGIIFGVIGVFLVTWFKHPS